MITIFRGAWQRQSCQFGRENRQSPHGNDLPRPQRHDTDPAGGGGSHRAVPCAGTRQSGQPAPARPTGPAHFGRRPRADCGNFGGLPGPATPRSADFHQRRHRGEQFGDSWNFSRQQWAAWPNYLLRRRAPERHRAGRTPFGAGLATGHIGVNPPGHCPRRAVVTLVGGKGDRSLARYPTGQRIVGQPRDGSVAADQGAGRRL